MNVEIPLGNLYVYDDVEGKYEMINATYIVIIIPSKW
jgi:hypothetical protein